MDDRCDLLCLDLPRAEELRRSRASNMVLERVVSRAAALGDPTRLGIAIALRAGEELCVGDLAWITERSQNLVSHHLRALRSADLVSSRGDGKMVMYRLTDTARVLLDSLFAWEAVVRR